MFEDGSTDVQPGAVIIAKCGNRTTAAVIKSAAVSAVSAVSSSDTQTDFPAVYFFQCAPYKLL